MGIITTRFISKIPHAFCISAILKHSYENTCSPMNLQLQKAAGDMKTREDFAKMILGAWGSLQRQEGDCIFLEVSSYLHCFWKAVTQ